MSGINASALHGVSPRNRWLCVLPRGRMNVNVNVNVIKTNAETARPTRRMPPLPPPPPPEGHVGIYHSTEPTTASSSSSSIYDSWRQSSGRIEGREGYQLGDFSKMLFSIAKAKVAEVDAKYDLSTAAAAAAAAAATSVAAASSAAAAAAVCKAQAAVSAVATRIDSMSPQEREKLATGAVVTAHVLQVVGGPKTRAAVCAAATLAAVSTQVSGSGPAATAAAPPSATTAAGVAPPGFSDSSGLTELFLLEVLASVPAGHSMLVHVDGLGDFQVTVPAGVRVGESFTFEAEAPIDKQPSGAPIESVPMGLPVQTEPQVPMGLPVPMAAQPVPMGAPVTSAAPVPSASRSGAVSGAAALPAQLGVASPGVVSSVGTALAAMSLARELGVTPQEAWVAANHGARLAKDLGVTPSAAASAGIAAMNLLAEMQKESISKTARRT